MKVPNFNIKKLNGLVQIGKTFVAAHRPEILLGMSVTSTVSAVVMAAKGGYEARGRVDAEYKQRVFNVTNEIYDETKDYKSLRQAVPELSVKEKIQLTWPCYVPAAGLTAAALGSTTALHFVHVSEKKAIATAALAAVDEVKRNVIDVSDEETQTMLENRADEEGKVRIEDANGNVEDLYLVRDGKTGRDIYSNKLRIESAVLDINNFIAKHGDCDLNSFYSNAGFETTPDGDDWGWSGDWVELKWDTTVRDDGRPVARFAFRTKPKEGYGNPR